MEVSSTEGMIGATKEHGRSTVIQKELISAPRLGQTQALESEN